MKPVRFNRRAFVKSAVASNVAAVAAALRQTAPVQQGQAPSPPSASPGYGYVSLEKKPVYGKQLDASSEGGSRLQN